MICSSGLTESLILFLEDKDRAMWMNFLVISYISPRMKYLRLYRSPYSFTNQVICGVGATSAYLSKVEFTLSQWDPPCYAVPNNGVCSRMCKDSALEYQYFRGLVWVWYDNCLSISEMRFRMLSYGSKMDELITQGRDEGSENLNRLSVPSKSI